MLCNYYQDRRTIWYEPHHESCSGEKNFRDLVSSYRFVKPPSDRHCKCLEGWGSISHCQRYSAGTPYESVFSYFFSNVSMHTSSSRPPCTHVVSGNVFWRLRFRPFRARSFSFNPKKTDFLFSSHPITYTRHALCSTTTLDKLARWCFAEEPKGP